MTDREVESQRGGSVCTEEGPWEVGGKFRRGLVRCLLTVNVRVGGIEQDGKRGSVLGKTIEDSKGAPTNNKS